MGAKVPPLQSQQECPTLSILPIVHKANAPRSVKDSRSANAGMAFGPNLLEATARQVSFCPFKMRRRFSANASRRVREVGLRKVVGAKRTQLISQFLGESLLMSATAFLLSLGLARVLLPVLNSLTAKNMTLFPL